MSVFLHTLGNNLFLVVGSVAFSLIAIITAIVGPKLRGPTWSARTWSRGLLFTGGTRVDVEFEEALDPDGVYVYLCNHQSLFDIPVLLTSLPTPTRFMAKRSLFRIPVFGWALHASGFIPVDRQNRTSGRRAMEDAVQLLQRGVSVMIFPEQTRSLDGKILPFRRGAFLIARRAGVPMVPIGVRGTGELRRKGSHWVRPGSVEVRYGRCVEPESGEAGARREQIESLRETVARLAGSELAAERRSGGGATGGASPAPVEPVSRHSSGGPSRA